MLTVYAPHSQDMLMDGAFIQSFQMKWGKNSGTIGVGNIGVGLNATVDQVVLIFERCIYHGKY